ncbi:MAG: LysR family transcriptional regulator [Achromobacter sp.]|jgi:DNA-binding transcriptional LysR family regulator|uniref:HTH-type transcriptional regulator HdfR n=3 Tax=Achromobacter insuavis TaxID=1287735 RepID=A0A6J5BDE6_9BURK|nr:LysR substrate-binding domain-containing protein [Achromobacter insuavis]MBN9640888.1 LysR family transcriptional regulator [Achromobacter sp.]CAB3701325.1 HTH-type transcriptional regulator HdfR [Achromobacter insuavis]CUJ43677.1 HTH-type transcriptional regulator YofA [Achromobacter sp. 2789STDY5608633]CUJ76989.1 HTH-type transcriptional regulator YofA [Achromobacter sp. 2789STDY5608628]
MIRPVTFDLDVLRSFVAGVELGSFGRAADRLGRSTSAVSAQLKKLEEQAGVPLLRKAGRGLTLTDAGETMLAYARRLLELNDQASVAVRGTRLQGRVRLGLQEDFGEILLPHVLGQFARAHPQVRIEARVARNAELLERVAAGELDLALAWDHDAARPHGVRLAELPLCWIGPAVTDPARAAPARDADGALPLVAFEAPCLFRSRATDALDRAGIAWTAAFISPSLAGLWAAASAGLGLMVRTPLGLPAGLRVLAPGEQGLPPLPPLSLSLYHAQGRPGPVAAALADIVRRGVRDSVAALPAMPGLPARIPSEEAERLEPIP